VSDNIDSVDAISVNRAEKILHALCWCMFLMFPHTIFNAVQSGIAIWQLGVFLLFALGFLYLWRNRHRIHPT
jgi:hypothetical protein